MGTFRADCLSYRNNNNEITTYSGATATLVDTGNETYSIIFSNNVPALINLKFYVKPDGTHVSVDTDGSTAGITFSTYNLDVRVSKTGESWYFLGNKW